MCDCSVRFQCQVTAEPEPTLAWFYNDQPLTSGPRVQLTFDKTTTTLTILGATLQDTGDYTCNATNALGEASTKTFLRVRRTYTMTYNGVGTNFGVGVGEARSEGPRAGGGFLGRGQPAAAAVVWPC